MRIAAGFIAALLTAAIIFVVIEDFANALGLSAGYFLFAVAMCSAVGLPAVVIGGVPTWLFFRRRGVDSAVAFALAGSTLALLTHLLLLAAGPLRSYDPPETFFGAFTGWHRVIQLTAAVAAGSVGAVTFWAIAVRRSRLRPAVAAPRA